MHADITGLPVCVPQEKEAACLGAAIISAVSDGRYASFAEAVAECVAMQMTYDPHPNDRLERKYRRFCALYQAALAVTHID